MMTKLTRTALLSSAAALLASLAGAANPTWGRFSLYFTQGRQTGTGLDYTSRQVVAAFSLRSGDPAGGGFTYALDLRNASYPGMEGRNPRTQVYEGWLGYRSAKGSFSLQLGQIWMQELGTLGSLGGILAEIRQVQPGAIGSWRAGVFAGLEPKWAEAGFATGVKKAGVYVALDGEGARRHVLGAVQIRNGSLTERRVVTLLNFVPVGREFFLYQAGEYDLQGPGGQGHGGLNYLFVNARWAPVERLDIQSTYHHGRSVDARGITDDELAGRPVDPRRLDGYLFESAGARVTVELVRGLRVWGGYYRDRNNSEDEATGRTQAGLAALDILGSGLDLTASDNRTHRPTGSSDAWYVSLGRTLGHGVYLSADYSTSVAVLRTTGTNGVVIVTRPEMKRAALSSIVNLGRYLSFLLTAEQIRYGDAKENRVLAGVTYRF